ncbi:MAG TPA: glycosyltransferase family 4 protein [Ignavibacteriales bacterium]|nr:glycosyltransferase family 4 protein [Ignavibacteriales bacterium]
MKKLKILFLGEYTYPIITGSSTHKVQVNLFDNLSQMGITSYFFEVCKTENKLSKIFGKIKLIKQINNSFVYTGGIIPFIFFIIFRINIIHFIVQRKYQLFFLPLVFLPWIKSFITLHDTLNFKKNPYFNKFPKSINFIKQFLVLFVSKILVYNELDKNYLPEIIKKKVILVKNGIHKIETNLAVKEKENYILFAGGTSLIKGYEIISQIAKSTNYKFIIAGVNKQGENIATENIQFIGLIPSDKMYDYIKKAKIVIIPSLYEPFSVLALESLYLGTPIIISQRCGISRYLKHLEDAIIVEPDDTKQIIKFIDLLFNDKDLYSKLYKNSSKLIEKFTWDIISKEYIEIYEK